MSVVASATILAAMQCIDQTVYGATVSAAIIASGAVSVLQGKTGNGHIAEEALAQVQRPGGKRRTDPPI